MDLLTFTKEGFYGKLNFLVNATQVTGELEPLNEILGRTVVCRGSEK